MSENATENGAETPERTTRLNDGEGLKIAQPEDLGISREDGKLLHVKQKIPGKELAIKVLPITGGVRQKYDDILAGQSDDWEKMAELWNDQIVEGPGSDASAEEIKSEWPYGVIAGINQALKNSSGDEIFLAVQEQQLEEAKADLQAMEMVGADLGKVLSGQIDEEMEENPELETPSTTSE